MSSPTAGPGSWRDTAGDAAGNATDKAADAAPDPKNLNPPARGPAAARDAAEGEGIQAFNPAARDAAERAEAARDEAAESAQEAAESAEAAASARAEVTAGDTATAPVAAAPAAAAPVAATGTATGTAAVTEPPADAVPMRAMKLGMAVTNGPGRFLFALARILIGWVFFWAFLDKLFGLGYATQSGNSWLNGGSPTTGYLSNVDGPFASFFNSMAGQTWADWLFMIGLAGIGLALILGIGMWIAAIGGTVLLVFMWMASLPMTSNPFLDEHLVYAVVILGLACVRGGDTLGLGKPWARSGLVRALPFLRLPPSAATRGPVRWDRPPPRAAGTPAAADILW